METPAPAMTLKFNRSHPLEEMNLLIKIKEQKVKLSSANYGTGGLPGSCLVWSSFGAPGFDPRDSNKALLLLT